MMAEETLRFQPAGLPWRRSPVSSASLRDLPISFFHGPVSASFFHRKRKILLFINTALYAVKLMPRRFFETPAKKESVKILPDGSDSRRLSPRQAKKKELQATLNNTPEL
ncbi:hypothetical protein [Alkalicoccus saliphilus]|uniref:hypothetical protein n=1 Tax=Alkalicoccus saliphilus TaxID=200989 RepID=UPI00135ABC41|nr:hypothetical protein [Alkalicoccus saliphilus]